MPEIRSRKVRKILALEAKAQRLLDRYQRHRDRIDPLRVRGLRLLTEARALETTLTGSQLGALRRGRLAQDRAPASSTPSTTD